MEKSAQTLAAKKDTHSSGKIIAISQLQHAPSQPKA